MEAPKYKFNVNVFKSGAKLALNDEELKQEEALVLDLARYLKHDQVEAIISDLRSGEGVPTDSESMQELFHRNGVNMRYLGQVYARLSQTPTNDSDVKMRGEPKHLKAIVEREILLRSAKHVFNRILKDEIGESNLHLGQCAMHLLNCLLSCSAFHHYMNNQTLKFQDETVQTLFSEFPEEMVSRKQEETAEQKSENLTKNQQKKKLQKAKKD